MFTTFLNQISNVGSRRRNQQVRTARASVLAGLQNAKRGADAHVQGAGLDKEGLARARVGVRTGDPAPGCEAEAHPGALTVRVAWRLEDFDALARHGVFEHFDRHRGFPAD